MEVSEFKKACLDLDPELIVQKHLIDGSSYFFDQFNEWSEFDFKKDIATILHVHIRDVVIVGSGKLGFSIKPDNSVPDVGLYLFKKFDEIKKSDLDIAIVSSHLFDKEIENLYKHTGWYQNFPWQDRNGFARYILKGRFVLRLLPNDFKLSKEIQAVQDKYKILYGRDINIEIYKSWYFFETYHKNNIFSIHLNFSK